MNYKLTDAQIATINSWLQDAYEAGRKAASEQKPVEASSIVYSVHGCICDLSSYDPKIDFDKLCSSVDFVILRARYCTKTDKTFEERAGELVKRGMPFGVYDYATLMNHSNAKAQAEAIFKLCDQYHPRIYYIDTEQLGTGVKYGDEYGYIETYVNTLRELGVERIGHYTGDWLYKTYYHRLQDLFDTLWIASYGKNNGTYDGVELASAQLTDKIDLHQYTDKGAIPGSTKRGDLSRLTGHKPLAWFTGRTY